MARGRRYNLDEDDRRILREDHRLVRSLYSERKPPRGRWGGGGGGGRRRIGVLDEALTAPASITSTLPTAAVSRYSLNTSTGKLEDSGETDELTNPFPGLSAAISTPVSYVRWSGIWIPEWVDCLEQNEKQLITVEDASGGTFTLALFGDPTSGIAHNAAASAVKSALEATSGIDEVTCTGGPLGTDDVLVEFGGSLANTQVPLMVADGSSLTGSDPTVTVTEDTAGCCG